jgi:hypothetical protein
MFQGMEKMTPERRNEIAFLMLRHYLKMRGFKIEPNYRRELRNTSVAIDVPYEELATFSKALALELVEETFGRPEGAPPHS